MESLFLSFWNRSVEAGWLILAVFLVRLAWRRCPKWALCLLWMLSWVRLLGPFTMESSLSLMPRLDPLPAQTETEAEASVSPPAFAVDGRDPAPDTPAETAPETAPEPLRPALRPVRIAALLWPAGMAAMGLWALAGWLRLRRRVAEAVPEEEGVWLCEAISAPFLLGLRRPGIYLPPGLEGESRDCVLAHERAHLRRRDHWTKAVGFVLLTVYWFNPLVWLDYLLLCRDIELACDELVVRDMGVQRRKGYAQALVQWGSEGHLPAAHPLAFGEVGIKDRVKNVLRYRRPAIRVAAAAAGLCLVATACFLTDPVTTTAPPPPEKAGYAAGALLYESPALSSMPVDGRDYGVVQYNGEALSLERDSQRPRFSLQETRELTREDLYTLLPTLADQEARSGNLLAPQDTQSITVRIYGPSDSASDAPGGGFSIWELTREKGGAILWLGEGGAESLRLYALVDLDKTLPYNISGVLWTYQPYSSELLPVRFAMAAELQVESGGLSRDPRGDSWTERLTVEAGETIYWRPSDFLTYTFQDREDPSQTRQETLRLWVVTQGGVYGGRTCAITNNQTSAAGAEDQMSMHMGLLRDSTFHTVLSVDSESGLLAVDYREDKNFGPRILEDGAPQVLGVAGDLTTLDGPAA